MKRSCQDYSSNAALCRLVAQLFLRENEHDVSARRDNFWKGVQLAGKGETEPLIHLPSSDEEVLDAKLSGDLYPSHRILSEAN